MDPAQVQAAPSSPRGQVSDPGRHEPRLCGQGTQPIPAIPDGKSKNIHAMTRLRRLTPISHIHPVLCIAGHERRVRDAAVQWRRPHPIAHCHDVHPYHVWH